jgi:hypothetical protein
MSRGVSLPLVAVILPKLPLAVGLAVAGSDEVQVLIRLWKAGE